VPLTIPDKVKLWLVKTLAAEGLAVIAGVSLVTVTVLVPVPEA
jgi:hypothetical protein